VTEWAQCEEELLVLGLHRRWNLPPLCLPLNLPSSLTGVINIGLYTETDFHIYSLRFKI
jgi:hypothetical protein